MNQPDEKPVPMCAESDPPATLQRAIESAINRLSAENASNTPDFILAKFLTRCLDAWNEGSVDREKWYGASLSINGGVLAEVRRLKAACESHTADAIKIAQSQNDLLLERARQAEELLAQVEELRSELVALFDHPLVSEHVRTELGKSLRAAITITPHDSLVLCRARRRVIEAASLWQRAREEDNTDLMRRAEQELDRAIDALNELKTDNK
jgi:hypothetical protein